MTTEKPTRATRRRRPKEVVQAGAGRCNRQCNRTPQHLTGHLVTMGELHRAGRYDQLADGVELVTGQSAMSVREFASLHADGFGGRRS